MSRPADLDGFCRRILECGDLDAKLEPPTGRLADSDPDGPGCDPPPLRPTRGPGLEMRAGAGALPRPEALREASARERCLARFAHHELMAAELCAWALLRWPELPAGLRRGLLGVLVDEQRHCRLYVERLRALGGDLRGSAHSDYFWKHVPALDRSRQGPRAFLCSLGLTLEQANLDFSLRYRDAFRAAGDEASARVCQRVHDDEIRHVALAARWLRRLDPTVGSEVERYARAVPFPLDAARAKGRPFHEAPRRRAGLSEAFIAHVRAARSSAERAGADPA